MPEKDYFYYSMIAAVFFATERVAVGFHFLLRALQAGIPAVPHHQDARERHVDVVTLGTLFQNLGLFCAELQDDKNALDFYQQAMKLLPENPVLLFRVGEFHFQRAMQRPDSRGEAAPVRWHCGITRLFCCATVSPRSPPRETAFRQHD